MLKQLQLKSWLLMLCMILGVGNAWADETKTIDFSSLNLTNGTQYSNPFTEGDVSVTFGGGANDGKYYTTGSGIRTYNGGYITITANENTITKIVYTFSTANYAPSSSTATWEPSTGSVTYGATTTWEGSATSVKVTSSFSHWRLQKVEVTYSTETDSRTDVSLSFAAANYTATLGEAFETPQLVVDPEAAASEVTYSSSNPGAATVNASTGAVTLVADGTTTITASIFDSEAYKNASAEYTLTVVDATLLSLWTEDFSSYSKDDVPSGGSYSYVSTDGGSATKIFEETLAGGESPELLVGKNTGVFQATVALENIEGDLILSFRTNNTGLKVTVSASDGTTLLDAQQVSAGENEITISGVTTDMESVTIKFESAGDKNTRLDNISLRGRQGEASEKVSAELSFGEVTEFTVEPDADFTAPTLTYAEGVDATQITYSQEGSEEVALVDSSTGEVIIGSEEGTVTITATFPGDDHFKAGTASYTITVFDSTKPGTKNNPYTVAQALEAAAANGVYVKGIVSQIDEISTQYGNATYWISDDGLTTTQFKIYRGKYLDNTAFTAEDELQLGDEVVITGNLSLYSGANQMTQGNYLVSLDRKEKAETTIVFKNEAGEAITTLEAALNDMVEVTVECNVEGATLTYTSSNEDVATYDEGYILATAEGEATITATFAGNDEYKAATATLVVTVVDARQEVTLTFNDVPAEINLDETATYVATPSVEGLAVTYSSSNEDVVMVDETTGEIAAMAVGTATITATFAGNNDYKPATASYTIKVVDPNSVEGQATLTSANIKASYVAPNGYAERSVVDQNGNTWNAYAMSYQHSNATSDHYYLQIKKSSSTEQYYIQVPEYGTRITKLEMTVSNSSKPMDGAGNTATLYFSASNETAAEGEGVASGSGASSITIDCSALNLNTGYITASGAVRIWNVTVTYEGKPESVTMTIGAAKYSTFIAPFDVEIPEGVTATKIMGAEGATLTEEAVEGTIPANTPVVLYSESTVNQEFTGVSTAVNDSYTVGLLTGVYTDTDAPLGSYVLQKQGDKVGFFQVTASATPKVRANRAYLTAPATSEVKAFYFGGADAINAVEAETEQGAIYNLAGQRVSKAVKGIYIINGKKVLK